MPSAILDQFGKPAIYGGYGASTGFGGTNGAIYAPYSTDSRTTPSHPDTFGDFANLLQRTPWRKAVSDCRWITAAFPLVGGAAEQKADYVGGSKFATYFSGEDTEWGDEAEHVFESVDKICTTRSPLFNWHSFWRCGILNLIDTGSFFINLTENDDGFPLLQPLEAHRVGSWDLSEGRVNGGPYDGAKIMNGIIYDRKGAEIAYRVLGYEYGDFRDISARDMIHVTGNPRYFSQGRPLPQVATALKDLYSVLDTRESEQIAQNANSRLTFVENNETGKQNAGNILTGTAPLPTAAGVNTEIVEKGFWRYVKNGGNLKAHESNRPSDQWDRFDSKITGTGLYGMRWRIEMLDLSKLSGAAVRGFADQINTVIQGDFGGIAPAMIRCRGYQSAKLTARGDLRENREWYKFNAQEPGEFSADPSRQISSEIEAVRAGMQSMPDVHRRWGKRSRQVLRDQARYLQDQATVAKEFDLTTEQLGRLDQPGDAPPAAATPSPSIAS